MSIDHFGDYLKSLKCVVCGEIATHSQDGRLVCNAHLVEGKRAFAVND